MAVGILRLQQGLDVSQKSEEELQNNQAKYNSCESLRRNQSYSHMSQGKLSSPCCYFIINNCMSLVLFEL